MYLLTWHGTLLRVENTSQRLIQAPLIPQRPSARDFAIPAQAVTGTETLVLPASNGVRLQPGPDAGTRCITIGGRYARALPGRSDILAEDTEPAEGAFFLVVAPETLAGLRLLLQGSWRAGDVVLDEADIGLEPGYRLRLGSLTLDLAVTTVLALGAGEVFVDTPDGKVTLVRAAGGVAPAELFLRGYDPDSPPELAADEAELALLPRARLRLPAVRELYLPPLTRALAERDWMYAKADSTALPPAGWHRAQAEALHHQAAYAVLASPAEGLIFAGTGETETASRLPELARAAPDVVSTEGEAVFLREAALADAPYLPCAVAVPYRGSLATAASVLAELLPGLEVLSPVLPPAAALLLPPHAAAETEALLAEFGHGARPCLRVAAPLCQAESVFSLGHQPACNLPAVAYRALRDRIGGRLPAAAGKARRIYLRGTGAARVHNAGPVEAMAKNQGFEILSPGAMDATALMAAFYQAEFVVAPADDMLGWLLCCKPGTKVIELAAEACFQPAASQVSAKLDLVHLVLPCGGAADPPRGGLILEPTRFRGAIWLLAQRQ